MHRWRRCWWSHCRRRPPPAQTRPRTQCSPRRHPQRFRAASPAPPLAPPRPAGRPLPVARPARRRQRGTAPASAGTRSLGRSRRWPRGSPLRAPLA
eukprot:73377-Chlamydomonas_euryale.AAC.1